MKKLLLACVVTCAGFSALASASYADTNEQMKNSKYCETNGSDPLCMGPESMAMRAKMMEMTKDNAIATRSKYCADYSGADKDPICDPKMMNDTTGY
jgi:hypothetical protein